MMSDSINVPVTHRNQVRLKHLVSVILWTILFTLAYAQSPLYTSNQNQYFLHGLADAGFGHLNQDWLANTLDPTPLFSGLIYLTSKFLFWPPTFYLYFSLLAGIYLFSLFGISTERLRMRYSKTMGWLYLTALVLIHSAALRYLVVRITNPEWAYLFDGGVAGQRLLGPVLQPSTFGVLIIMSICLYLRGKIGWAVLFLVLAPTAHPTYLLSAAVLTLVYMWLSFQEGKKVQTPLIIGGTAFLGVLPILIHTYSTFKGTDPVSMARARELLVTFRIPHHAVPIVWFDSTVLIKVGFILFALYISRKTRIFHILFWPFAVTLFLSVAQIITHNDALALLFPWRLSTWLVPISVATITLKGIEQIWPWIDQRVSDMLLITANIALVIGLAVGGLAKSIWEGQEKKGADDRSMMAYVRSSKTPGSVYLIPLDMQDFRLETGASAYIEFKSIPYKDIEILEWYRRVGIAGRLYRAPMKRTGCKILSDLYAEGVTNVVLPYDHTVQKCPNLVEQYVDENYQVYQLIGGDTGDHSSNVTTTVIPHRRRGSISFNKMRVV